MKTTTQVEEKNQSASIISGLMASREIAARARPGNLNWQHQDKLLKGPGPGQVPGLQQHEIQFSSLEGNDLVNMSKG